MDEDIILYVTDLMRDDPAFGDLYIDNDEYGNIVVEGDYFTVYVSPVFEDGFMTFDSYTIAVTHKSNGARDFVYRFYDINDAFYSIKELNTILSALQSFDGVLLQM